jgi:hypothetical protein
MGISKKIQIMNFRFMSTDKNNDHGFSYKVNGMCLSTTGINEGKSNIFSQVDKVLTY